MTVAYAGSMGVVMDHGLGPAFTKQTGVAYQGIGQGALALAHLLAAGTMHADVFVSITPGPVKILEKAGLVTDAVPIASTAMVIAYSPKSSFAAQLAEAAAGKRAWYKVLEEKNFRFGRTDPATDPQGQNILFTFQLAETYYHQPGLSARILGPSVNPAQIFAEPALLADLDDGQLDATSGYESAVKSLHLPFIRLPDQINLSNPAMAAQWYSKAAVTLTIKGQSKIVHTQPLVFYAAVLKNAQNPQAAAEFVTLLASPQGQKILHDDGYSAPKGGNI
jgi:molybdate/tungstate transport system substrate-binding protein